MSQLGRNARKKKKKILLHIDQYAEEERPLPTGVKIVGFAEDITLVVYGESMEEVELTAAHSIFIVEEWMKSRKLGLARHKTEVVVVNNRKSEQRAR